MQLTVIKPAHQKREPKVLPFRDSKEKMTIVLQSGTKIIQKSKVNYLKANSNYCEIHLNDGSKILCSKTMKEISEKLNSPHFIKVHSSYIVNISKIIFVNNAFQLLTIQDGTQIPIARMRKNDIKDMLKKQFD